MNPPGIRPVALPEDALVVDRFVQLVRVQTDVEPRKEGTVMKARETDSRVEILNTLLTTPHRKLEQTWPVHRAMVEADPRLYVRLAAWYNDHGDVRDHKEMFIIALVLSAFEGHREVGLALLRGLPPYEVARVLDFIHGRKVTRKLRTSRPKTTSKDRADEAQPAAETTRVVEPFGLFRNPPRSLRTEIARYLREREADPEWFDSTALVARKALKRLYALLHVAPGERAQKVLFDEQPPPGSRITALKELARCERPADQARAILEHAIPYRVAASVIKQMTPTVLLALIERMSPQELINNLGSLKRRGAFDNPDLKAAMDAKLDAARTSARVSAFKAEEAVKAAELSDDVRRALETVADSQVKARGRIDRPTALLIDKSSSMSLAIELGKRIGALVSAISSQALFVYAFDSIAYPIETAGSDLASWEKALQGISSCGSTSCGVAVEMMRRKAQYVEQIIMITDEEENNEPYFVEALQRYRSDLKADPNVCFVRTPGAGTTLEDRCRAAGIAVDAFQFTGDYYALPNLVPFLSRPSRMDLLMEILEYPLPVRKPA